MRHSLAKTHLLAKKILESGMIYDENFSIVEDNFGHIFIYLQNIFIYLKTIRLSIRIKLSENKHPSCNFILQNSGVSAGLPYITVNCALGPILS